MEFISQGKISDRFENKPPEDIQKCYPVYLAIATVLPQSFDNVYPTEQGLCAGTVFADLDKPFVGGSMI